MRYVIQYELCALFFLIITMARFFEMRRFPSLQNKLFGIILCVSAADIALDLVGAYTLSYGDVVPLALNYAVNVGYFFCQIVLPALMLMYVVVSADLYYSWRKRLLPLMMLPTAAPLLVLLFNYWTGGIFYFVTEGGFQYIHGPAFKWLYIIVFFYMALAAGIVVARRKLLDKKHISALVSFFAVLTASIALQYRWPQYLLTGVAISVALLMVFFTLQNPEDMLDLITGVFNYSAMMAFLKTQLTEHKPLWLVAIDVGGIRRVNSAFGVAAGNNIFSQIGGFLNQLEGEVWCFRMYGSRFLIVASDEEKHSRVINVVERRFERPWTVGTASIMLSCTIRYFGRPDFFQSPEDVVNLVDMAYSETGADGWGHKKAIEEDVLLRSKRRIDVENSIREALASGQGLELWYQPIYSISTGRFVSAEALLRLHSPMLGWIPPTEFIGIAERSELILEIDELVIKLASDMLRRNGSHVISKLEINLSAVEFFNSDFRRLYMLLAESGVPPERLCFEVTETAAASHTPLLNEFMRTLIPAGFSFALDDFGTGFANITRVAALPFSIVKFDSSMLAAADKKNELLFEGLVETFTTIGMNTVIEGVETEEQARLVKKLGVHEIQGYLYARPMPEKEFLEFMLSQSRENSAS